MGYAEIAVHKSRQPKQLEQVVSYALGHRTRVEILIILQQGVYSPGELAEIIGVPLNNLSNHVSKMAQDGSIELVETRKRRNVEQSFYRAVEFPEYSAEELTDMTPHHRRVTVGLIVQSLLAEILASLWRGKISEDPHHVLAWTRLTLDEAGRREVTDEQERHWHRLKEIEERSLLRAATSEDASTPYIVATLGFERGRKAPRPS